MDKKTEKEIKNFLKEIEGFLVTVPVEKREAYMSFIKAAYLNWKESQMNEEFLKLIIPLLESPDKDEKKSNEVYTWNLMKQR